jgi:predicted RNA-binding Zn-ribbon protein involved in translation (DUF1610 family)
MVQNKMTCPDCGTEMNHHAMKIDYASAIDAPEDIDPIFYGVLQEAHTCPNCGRIELRNHESDQSR